MLCKDRVFERFRSLYTQRPTQGSELRRRLVFNAEEAEYACISRVASRDHNILAQEGIVERISVITAQSAIKLSSTDPGCSHCNYRGRNSYSFSTSLFTFFLLFFQDVEVCSCSAEGCRCLISGSSSDVNIERYSHRFFIKRLI